LELRVIENAIVVPRATFGDKQLGAGVVRSGANGRAVVDGTGVRRRGREYVLAPEPDDVVATERLDRAVYGGFLFAHYGHFLLESLGRLWPEVLADVPVMWIAGTAPEMTPWMTEMLDLLQVPDDRIVVNNGGPIEVAELLVADPGFEVQRFLHPWFRSRLEIRDAARVSGSSRIWLSRSALGSLAGVAEECEIEAQLADHGWTVVHPETLPLGEQIDLLAGASHLAGIEGSAFHTLLFVRGYRGTIDLVTRHGSTNFEVIAATAGWDQLRHPMYGGTATEWKRPSGARDVRWAGVDTDKVVRAIVSSSRA
jgi:hypothetical protein